MELTDSISKVRGVGVKKSAAFARLGIRTVYDLLTYYPRAYEDQSSITRIADLQAGMRATVLGVIQQVTDRQTRRRGFTVLTALIGDGTGYMQAVWSMLSRRAQISLRRPFRRAFGRSMISSDVRMPFDGFTSQSGRRNCARRVGGLPLRNSISSNVGCSPSKSGRRRSRKGLHTGQTVCWLRAFWRRCPSN